MAHARGKMDGDDGVTRSVKRFSASSQFSIGGRLDVVKEPEHCKRVLLPKWRRAPSEWTTENGAVHSLVLAPLKTTVGYESIAQQAEMNLSTLPNAKGGEILSAMRELPLRKELDSPSLFRTLRYSMD